MEYFLLFLTLVPISLLPGFNMILAFSLGLSLGYKATLWVMVGQLVGLALAVGICILSLNFLLQFDFAFQILKYFSIAFLLYMSVKLWRSKLSIKQDKITKKRRFSLMLQGFITSVSNPKVWIFFLSLLPSFIHLNLFFLMSLILSIEFSCLSLYALGGSVFKRFMNAHLDKIGKFSALCIVGIALSFLLE
ncbi:LysE family translocator [Campylobacter upsaliensis]|nr:LysE family translocator [Campylobacter upsaliensis]